MDSMEIEKPNEESLIHIYICSHIGCLLMAAGLFWLSQVQPGDNYATGVCGGGKKKIYKHIRYN
jgi:hypothetical protein